MKIPFSRQKNVHYCAPAVAQMILAAYGTRISQDRLAREMKTPLTMDKGTSVSNLVSTLRKHGARVHAGNNQTVVRLRRALAQEKIVIVCYTEPVWGWGHYALVRNVGAGKISLIDPDTRTGRTTMTLAEFARRWKDPTHTKTLRWAAFVGR